MSQLVRKQVYIEPRHETILKRATAETGLSEAEIIRQAIDLWQEQVAERQRARQLWSKERAFIESWVAQGAVSGEGRTWARDELYEERMERYDGHPG
jgi:Arc/MetJ-type ribon-helix-helix transcriptional regulator